MTTLILWIVYNPHTGECVYYGTDNAAARAALNERNLMAGFVCHPVTAFDISEQAVTEARAQTKAMIDEFQVLLYGDPNAPKPVGILHSEGLKPIPRRKAAK